MTLEQGRLDVIAAGQFPGQMGTFAADQKLCAFLPADVQVGLDLGDLDIGSLCADHGFGVERVPLLDRGHAFEHTLHELVVDGLLDQGTRRAGADFALVEGEQDQTFDGFIQEVVVFIGNIGKKDIGRFST
ncbi:hypothetical protein GALL_391010 [mine drainage metagenome]|uniref:Uncharacterized protein n=1 Tax=mine drainage metagenome TaxID=410659 RepID=A0A1J5QNT8_9ZZZZ